MKYAPRTDLSCATPEERDEHVRAYQRNYARSERRKASRRKYNQSERGKAKNNAQCTRWRLDNRDKYLASLKKADLKRYYNLTPEQHAAMFASQDFSCAVCRVTKSGRSSGVWATDHCHVTGHVRGILCHGCNGALGQAKDNPATLRALADYLERGQL